MSATTPNATAQRATFEAMIAADPQRLRRRSISLGVAPGDADDVAQNALLRAWRSIEQLETPGAGAMCSWLDTIARNAASDLARQQARRRTDAVDDDPVGPTDVADEVEMRRILDGALQAIHALPAELREPLLLSAVDGLSATEIGERLQVTPAAARQRISRARRSLATCRRAGMSEHA